MLDLKHQKQITRLPKGTPPNLNICMVCSMPNCRQSINHAFVSFDQLKSYALEATTPNCQIENAKIKITQFYNTLIRNVRVQLEKQCLKAREEINKYYYSHLTQLKSYQSKIMCQVIENDAKSLPSKKTWGIVRTLRQIFRKRQSPNEQKTQRTNIDQFYKKLTQKIQKFSHQSFYQCLKNQTQQVQSLFGQEDNSTLKNLKSSVFSQASTNEQQILQWRNIRIRNIVKNVVISCKKINDPQFLLNTPKLQKFPNIMELDARQNNLTHLSCAAVSNYLPQLLALDLRSNNIGDLGVFKLKNLSFLKQLMISQNGVGDNSALYILQGFPALQVLWIDNNKITEKGALLLYEKQMLKICSAVCNLISMSYYEKIKSLFSRKGLIYL